MDMKLWYGRASISIDIYFLQVGDIVKFLERNEKAKIKRKWVQPIEVACPIADYHSSITEPWIHRCQ